MKYILTVLLFAGIYWLFPFMSKTHLWVETILFHKKISWTFFSGFIVYLLLSGFSKTKQHIQFIMVFIHELMHAVTAIVTGGNVSNFNAGLNGGEVHLYSKKYADTLVTLAPYTIPVIPAILLFLVYFSKNETNTNGLMSILFGLSYSFYLMRVINQSKPYQPDLKHVGILVSYILITSSNIFFFLLFGKILKP